MFAPPQTDAEPKRVEMHMHSPSLSLLHPDCAPIVFRKHESFPEIRRKCLLRGSVKVSTCTEKLSVFHDTGAIWRPECAVVWYIEVWYIYRFTTCWRTNLPNSGKRKRWYGVTAV